MTVRAVRNIAAEKKKDTMMPITIGTDGISTNPGSVYPIGGGQNNFAMFCFMPSARAAREEEGFSFRKKRLTYSRGYSERVSLATNGQGPWIWRRIVFTKQMLNEINGWIAEGIPSDTGPHYRDSIHGQMRTMWDLNEATDPARLATRDLLMNIMFAGTQDRDWLSPITAPLNSRHIKIKYDKTIHFGNANSPDGILKLKRFWHPVNHTLRYGGKEDGAVQHFTPYSGITSDSVGDLVIVDIILGSNEEDTCSIGFEGTYYWHEGAGN